MSKNEGFIDFLKAMGFPPSFIQEARETLEQEEKEEANENLSCKPLL